MIKKIIIEVGGKEIELTPKQAKRLYDELDELYGKDTDTVYPVIPYYPYRWRYPWNPPYYIGDVFDGTYTYGNLCHTDSTANITIANGDYNESVTTGDCLQNAGVTFTS